MKIDVFLFNDEYELLEIRIKENWDFFDKFVLIEGDRYFNGKPRKTIKDNKIFLEKFKWAKDKLSIYTSKNLENIQSGFENERIQIKYGEKILNDLGKGNEIFWSAVDEIPSKKALHNFISYSVEPCVFKQSFYYYYLNGLVVDHYWNGTVAFRSKDLRDNSLQDLVDKRYFDLPKIDNGGWHFSYIGGAKRVIEKINTFSHQELNSEEFKNENKIIKIIKEGKDIFNRKKGDPLLMGNEPINIKYVYIDAQFPNYIRLNRRKFKKLIKFDLNNYLDFYVKKIKKLLKKN